MELGAAAWNPAAVETLNSLNDARPLALSPDGQTAFVLTGVGIPCTLARLFTLASARGPFRLALNVGIAGAYPNSGLEIGDIVIAGGETFADVGYETPANAPVNAPGFETFAHSPLGKAFYGPVLPTVAPAEFLFSPPADAAYRVHVGPRGATVNACTGTHATGARRATLTGAAFESMEGAAVAVWGSQTDPPAPVCEIRAISNLAADRDMRPENIRHALDNLAHYLAACRL